jgi:Nif-specific regulatory protein
MQRNLITRRYQIVRPLGEGGTGEVFLVKDLWESGRQVALKKLRAGAMSTVTRESFVREFTALKQLRHPNLSSVYDFGYTPLGDPFFTSEYCVGSDLFQATSQMGFGERIERAVEICRALSYIHARGYVHSDLKPENIIVLSEVRPDESSVKVLDFGLAHHVRDQDRHRLGGTLAYVAPETLKGRPLDPRADLYSLGVVLYQIFTRQLPFGNTDPHLLIDMQLSVTPAPPTEKDGTLPVAIDRILLRLLDKDPDGRFQTPEEVIQAFNQEFGYQYEIETHATARGYIHSGRFVGRTDELSQLKKALGNILEGHGGQLILVGGESGVGKTRLLEEFKTHAQLEGVRTFTGTTYEKISQPFQGFLDIVRPMVLGAQQPSSSHPQLLEKYEPTLGQLLPHLFGTRQPAATKPPDTPGEKELLLESLASFILESCSEQPTLILIQDIQWADALSMELIARITRELPSHQTILAASFRSDEIQGSALQNLLPTLSGSEGVEIMMLKPLEPTEVGELVSSMLGIEYSPQILIDRIVQNTQGNPFFIQEILWSWIEDRVISPRMTDQKIDSALLGSLQVPQTMTDAFLRRIGHLSESKHILLQTLSLFNRPASISVLASVLDTSAGALQLHLDTLVERAILIRSASEETPSYFFKHVQMKYSIETGVDPAWGQRIHRLIGEYYESETNAPMPDFSESLAYHFASAGEVKKARFYLIRMGDRLRKLFAFDEAIHAYRQAESYSDASDDRLLEIREKIGFCTYQQGLYSEAEEIFLGLIKDGGGKLTASRKAKLHLRLGIIAQHQGDYEASLEILDHGLTCIQSLSEPKTKADILARIGDVYHRLSNYPLALQYVLQALATVEHLDDYFGLGDIYNHLFVIYYFLGDYTQALQVGHRAISIYSKFGWLKGVAGMTANLGAIFEDHMSSYRKALEYQRRALQLRERILDRRGIEQSYLNLASINTKIGRYSTALEYLDLSAKLNKAMPERHLEMLIANHRGENWTHIGELAKARTALDEALTLACNSHNQQVRISTLNRLSSWHEKLGEWELASECSKTALDLAIETKSKLEGLMARVNLARIEMERGNSAGTEEHLEMSLTIAQEMKHEEWNAQIILLKASLVFGLEQYEKCKSILAQNKDIFGRLESPIVHANFHLLEGKTLLRLRDRYQHFGADDLQQASRLAESIEDPDLLAQTLHALGEWHLTQQDRENALKYFQQATSLIISAAERLPHTLQEKYLEKENRARILRATDLASDPTSLEVSTRPMLADSTSNNTHNRQNYFVTLFQISKIINSILNLHELLERVMDLVLEAIRVERGLILLVNEESGELEVKVARNISKETLEDASAISKSVLEEVVHGGKPLISVNAHDDQRLRDRHSIVDFGIGMVLCIPLTVKEKIVGAVYIDNPVATLPFNEEDVNFLMSFTNLFAIAIENARLYEKVNRENLYLRQEIRGKYAYENIVGRSPRMLELFRRMDSVISGSANVLITGESGTGKELIARAIHYNGSRKEKRFVAIDCGAIPENLIESELFGYKKGAFTGAVFDKKGLFEEADGGTVFLDEITNTSRSLQAKLLRVVQEREIRRVGDFADRKVDVRLIAATNRDLKHWVQTNQFREDLYYRLNVLSLHIPPLRERKEDIPLLANHILKELVEQNPSLPHAFSRDAIRTLSRYDFPGNIRELENVVESAFYMAQKEEIQVEDFPPEISAQQNSQGLLREETSLRDMDKGPSKDFGQKDLMGIAGEAVQNQASKVFKNMEHGGSSFWKVVKDPFMQRELSKEVVREVVRMGLMQSNGKYKGMLEIFHVENKDYTVFMNFLRKHDCLVDFRPFRKSPLSYS